MMTVYSREYYQAGLAEGKIKAKKLDKYRLGPDFILAYDLGPAASDMTPEIRTLISGVIFMTKYTKEIKLAIYH
ncbi:hypothetical protein EFM15_09050, partial [Lactobacillus delbrueckii]|nr:hypothetical protein [Lactobacillus delbrueckii]